MMQPKTEAGRTMDLPAGLTDPAAAYPTVVVRAKGVDLRKPRGDGLRRVNEAVRRALCAVHRDDIAGQTLLKVHVGEPKNVTRMRPAYAKACAMFVEKRNGSGLAAGDTTVAYTGPRGHRQNPLGDAASYLALARKQGWSPTGAARLPFVVLDRPSTAVPGVFEFRRPQLRKRVQGVERFRDFFLAGGFEAAAFTVNYAHLTLHGLAGVAGCVKSVAMGCTALRGKLRMHKALHPKIDVELCAACGACVRNCPEDALVMDEKAGHPVVNPRACIGCGECEAVCALRKGAIKLTGYAITDWERGADTLPRRMADYVIGLMQDKWDRAIHVLHLTAVTERCDCVDVRQKPMIETDLGFLIGKNPFAIDRLGGRMLAEALEREGRKTDENLLTTAERSAAYVNKVYGIVKETPIERIDI